MRLDEEQKFSEAQAFAASGASTNIIDLVQARDIFSGEKMVVLVKVDVAANYTTNETYAFALQMDTVENFASPTQIISRSIGYATLVAGYKFTLPVPMETTVEQYLRVYATLGGTTPTISISAYLIPASFMQTERTYPGGFTVS